MKKLLFHMAVTALLAGCASTEPLELKVTPLGQEPAKVQEQIIYALPQTILKVEVTFQETRSVPGPYWEYAERYLGLTEVVKTNSSQWNIWDVALTAHQELDPQHFYSLNIMDGIFNGTSLGPFLEQGIVMSGSETVHESIKGNGLQSTSRDNFVRYVDLGVDGNFEERTETMYKTIVTDTAFVEVPVQRTVVEQKSSSTKAREAADFLLELRTRRFEMLTGEYEVYPDGEAMGASIQKLDQMEASYLSLFTGKTITRILKRTWFIVPSAGVSPSTYPLDIFSASKGFATSEVDGGQPLEIEIRPLGKTIKIGGYFSAMNIPDNALLYRIPDVAELKVKLGEQALSTHRISIYQSGHMLTAPLH